MEEPKNIGETLLLGAKCFVLVSESVPEPMRDSLNEGSVAALLLMLNKGDMDKSFSMIESIKFNLGKLEKEGKIGVGSDLFKKIG